MQDIDNFSSFPFLLSTYIMGILWFFAILCVLQSNIFTAATQKEYSDRTESLMDFLKHFNHNRHHVTNPVGKKKAQEFISQTFQDLGLVTWFEKFKPDYPKYATGENIVGMLPGKLAGSPDDRLFLIGAHYDTMRTTSHGTDDNGSGVVAMLQVAKQLAKDFSNCTRSFSVVFVAFDFEEWELYCSNQTVTPRCACGSIDCGSRAFVANFTRFYNGSLKSNGKFQGAIIMDTMFNYNTTSNSQRLPPGVDKLAPEIYHQIKEDEFRGYFLSMVGRGVDDAALLNSFWYHYSQVKSALGNKTTIYQVNLPFHGPPSPQDEYWYGDFLRSDHVSFWSYNPSMSAIFLSDTADQRGYMTSCYHQNCDSLSHVTPEMLQFLQKTTDTILAMANDVTKLSCDGSWSQTTTTTTTTTTTSTSYGMKGWEIALLALGMILLGALIAGAAFAFYLRRIRKEDPFVSQDHLQTGFNTKVI
ncbi:uncharacterized protein LOC111328956 isoform X2 [Stylophora pistillata]|uniref:uncharacterized protein LOC111328956 isoform X2 n=1 Tax=Stylophora pistillata TaxID=50429 RepID=UPI000C05578C|nr:uncharacterized protein LOC111328956 isoform X2 [Stylophora pistillata]